MDTVSDSDFNADSASKSYYERLQGTEGTAINTIDMLNANPKVFLKYVDNSSKTAKYVVKITPENEASLDYMFISVNFRASSKAELVSITYYGTGFFNLW